MRWMPVLNRGDPRTSETTLLKRIGTSWVVSHIGYNSESIPQWAAYTWHRRIDIILYEGNMRTCLRALAAG